MASSNNPTEPGRTNLGGEHLRADGQPDRRFKEHGGGGHGNQGGRESGFIEEGDGTSSMRTEGVGEEGVYKPKLHGGETEGGGHDSRVSSEHGFGGDRGLAHEAGIKGGKTS